MASEEEMKKKTGVFVMTPEVAIEFYKRKAELGLTTEKECVRLLARMALEGKMQSVYETSRTKEQITQDYNEKFNVLDLRKKATFWSKLKHWLSTLFKG